MSWWAVGKLVVGFLALSQQEGGLAAYPCSRRGSKRPPKIDVQKTRVRVVAPSRSPHPVSPIPITAGSWQQQHRWYRQCRAVAGVGHGRGQAASPVKRNSIIFL